MYELTPQEIAASVDSLKKLEPGFLPIEIFEQIARLVRLPVVDIIPVQRKGSDVHVGLLKRDRDDRWWPDMWHVPGTILRSTDTMETAISRLITKEIQVEKSDEPVFHTSAVHQSDRGAEIVFLYSLSNSLFQPASEITWFPIDKLPENCIESEKKIIEALKKCISKV